MSDLDGGLRARPLLLGVVGGWGGDLMGVAARDAMMVTPMAEVFGCRCDAERVWPGAAVECCRVLFSASLGLLACRRQWCWFVVVLPVGPWLSG